MGEVKINDGKEKREYNRYHLNDSIGVGKDENVYKRESNSVGGELGTGESFVDEYHVSM